MSYTHLSPMERARIELLRKQGHSYAAIGKEIGRHRTTISRELRRNGPKRYTAEVAQVRYQKRRKACRPQGRLAYAGLREYVTEKIAEKGWTPQLVAGRIQAEYAGHPSMRVCHETIYQAIYANRHHLDFLIEFLPQARPKRRKRGQGKTRRGPLIPNRVSIHERPKSVELRNEIGHWEGDLVVGKAQDGFILTLVERVARLSTALKLKAKRAADVCQAVVEALIDLPVSWVKSITFDNGTEFRDHQAMSKELGVPVYFADPYAAYQRGSNEQFNGLLRRYLPKGTSFANLDQDMLNQITEELNNRPRKCLDYRTPNEVFQQQRQQRLRALGA